MTAAWCEYHLMAPFTVKGACNRVVFETWLEQCLVPVLRPGQVVVMDSATFHKGGNIEKLIEQAGDQLGDLPPYSPDLNKIERCWSWLTSRIRHSIKDFSTLREAMEHVFKMAFSEKWQLLYKA